MKLSKIWEEYELEYLSMNRNILYKRLRRLLRKYKLYIVGIALVFGIVLLCFFIENAKAGVVEAPIDTSRDVLVGLSTTADAEPFKIEVAREDAEMLAKLIWGEARGIPSTEQKAAVVWCVLNRVDSPLYPNSIDAVVTQKHQFSGYSESYPLVDDFVEIAEDVLIRWYREKAGAIDVGRVLPKEYLYFVGDGILNYFSKEWKSQEHYDWSLPSPYED